MSDAEQILIAFCALAFVVVSVAVCTAFYDLGKRHGVVAEWNRINDAKLEKDRLRRLRDGRTREHKQAAKIPRPSEPISQTTGTGDTAR